MKIDCEKFWIDGCGAEFFKASGLNKWQNEYWILDGNVLVYSGTIWLNPLSADDVSLDDLIDIWRLKVYPHHAKATEQWGFWCGMTGKELREAVCRAICPEAFG